MKTLPEANACIASFWQCYESSKEYFTLESVDKVNTTDKSKVGAIYLRR